MVAENLIQTTAIDVKDWTRDPQHFLYPEGARPKKAFFPPRDSGFDFILTDRRYLFKSSSNAPPDQFWAEIVAYKIGCFLGVTVPPAFVAFNSDNNISAALIEWFYVDGQKRFTHGGDILKSVITDFDSHRGTKHNLETIERICNYLLLQSQRKGSTSTFQTDYIKYWGEVFLFDTLIGNTDRHQNNWGLLRAFDNGSVDISLSPLFDNGTSLGSDRYTHIMDQWTEDRFISYINKGCHHMRKNLKDKNRIQHTDMLVYYLDKHPDIKAHLYGMISGFSFDSLEDELSNLMLLDLPEKLSQSRANYYLKLTKLRFNKIIEVLE